VNAVSRAESVLRFVIEPVDPDAFSAERPNDRQPGVEQAEHEGLASSVDPAHGE
jgi:hypothetical protein